LGQSLAISRRAAEVSSDLARAAHVDVTILNVATAQPGPDATSPRRRRLQSSRHGEGVLPEIVEVADCFEMRLRARIRISDNPSVGDPRRAGKARDTLIVLGVAARPSEAIAGGQPPFSPFCREPIPTVAPVLAKAEAHGAPARPPHGALKCRTMKPVDASRIKPRNRRFRDDSCCDCRAVAWVLPASEATRMGVRSGASFGGWVVAAASAIGLVICIFNFVDPGSGIAGSAGALLVIASSALILAAGLLLAVARSVPGWLRVSLDALLLLGVIGTGFAAYMLEAPLVLGAMAVALIGWFIHIFGGGGARTASILGAPV
jgi:hypothetical protein